MTHYTTLIHRCRLTNPILADDFESEFRRLEASRGILAAKLECAREGLKDIAGRAHSRLADTETKT